MPIVFYMGNIVTHLTIYIINRQKEESSMKEIPKLETTAFESNAFEKRLPHYSRYRPFSRYVPVETTARRTEDKTASMLTKLGISTAVCALLLAFMLSDVPLVDRIAGNIETLLQYEVNPEEALGRLKFVKIPNFADVFGARSNYKLPIQDGEVTVDSKTGLVKISGEAQCDVLAFDAGTVIDAGNDDAQNGYIKVDHGQGLVSCYFGLAAVKVEKNQPLKKGDALGRTGLSGGIDFEVTLDGQAQDVLELLGLKKN